MNRQITETELNQWQPKGWLDEEVVKILQSCNNLEATLITGIALARKSDFNPGGFIRELSREQTGKESRRLSALADGCDQGKDVVELLRKSDQLLPPTVLIALQLAAKQNSVDEFLDSVVDRPQLAIVRSELDYSLTTMIAGFAIRAVFIVGVSTFVLLKIIPEFMKILAEFGLDLPPALGIYVSVVGKFSEYWFLSLPVLLICGFLFLPKIWEIFQLLSPLKWKDVRPVKATQFRQSLAIALNHTPSHLHALDELASCRQFRKLFSRIDRAKTGLANQDSLWSALAKVRLIDKKESLALGQVSDPSTAEWILNWSAINREQRNRKRVGILIRALISIGNLVLAVIVLMTAIGVVSFLTRLIYDLS
ncbi:MAG: hypothetical protein AAF939_02410 [Planctomycetota bacterium]